MSQTKHFLPGGSGQAGAVDEDSFIQAFEDVKQVSIFSGKSLSEELVKIRDTLSKTSNDWKVKMTSKSQAKSTTVLLQFNVFFPGADRRFEERPELAASWGGRLRRDVRQPQATGAGLPVLSQRPQVTSGPGGMHHNLIHVTATQAPSRQIRRSPHAVSHKPNTGNSN